MQTDFDFFFLFACVYAGSSSSESAAEPHWGVELVFYIQAGRVWARTREKEKPRMQAHVRSRTAGGL